jgi:hypothetical protein
LNVYLLPGVNGISTAYPNLAADFGNSAVGALLETIGGSFAAQKF